ncbi:ABC transporter permease [Bacillus sp. Bva_UNVM-123]|uniref:ABC transporter permease n=1 Tax=Bacillus sp. Bva_UNVM-123 TaxID=2829798 RepID=UPI00391F8775
MGGLLLAKIQRFARNPWLFVSMVAFTLVFAYLMGGNNSYRTIPIAEDGKKLTDSFLEQLNTSDDLVFEQKSKEELLEMVRGNEVEAGILLVDDGYKLVYTVESHNISLIEQKLSKLMMSQYEKEQLINAGSHHGLTENDVDELLTQANKEPIFSLKSAMFEAGKSFTYDSRLHSIFGFSLFFVIYTISTFVSELFVEKQMGIRDRIILSPVRKWEMYGANLIYSFVLGYIQLVLIFLFFRYVAGIDFYGGIGKALIVLIPYVFTIVALSMFITGLVKSNRQYNAFIPLVSVSMAMLGGAYWPIEIVSSPILQALSKISPITYGMEILKGVTIYQMPLSDLLFPISMLMLIGVVLMGIGINAMERR